jgi:hypothetical protein
MLGADREDTLTRSEYLAVRGYDTDGSAPDNGSAAPTDEVSAPSRSAPESGPDPGRQCAWCGGPIPAGTHGLARYCSQAHRRAASRAREVARKRPEARTVSVLAATAVAGNGAGVALDWPAPAPFPAAEIDTLLGLGSVGDVTLERAGWRLVAHPR